MDNAYIESLVAKYEMLRAQREELEGQAKEVKTAEDAAKLAVIRGLLDVAEQTGVDDLTVQVGGFKYFATVKDFFGIPKMERDDAFSLLRELGHGNLITEKVDDRTLTKELAGVLEENHGEWPGEYEPLLTHLSRYTKPDLSRRKA